MLISELVDSVMIGDAIIIDSIIGIAGSLEWNSPVPNLTNTEYSNRLSQSDHTLELQGPSKEVGT
jgi:hypothetical protein